MFLDHTVAVVVPAYNERKLVGRVIRTMPGLVDRVYVVDDASVDGTADQALAPADPRVRVLRHAGNRGVGAAILTGYRAAIEEGMMLAAVMAGDGQMDPADLETLLRPVAMGQADYAKGDRLSWPGAFRRMPFSRYLGNHLFSVLSRMLCGYPELRDSQCGFTAIRVPSLAAMDLDAVYPRYGFPNDFLSRLSDLQVRLAQVPVRPVYGSERSGITLFTALVKMPLVILSAWVRSRRARRERSLAGQVPVRGLLSADRP